MEFLEPEELFGSEEEGKVVSEETYWQTYYDDPDFNYEWVNGRLEEVPVSNQLTFTIYSWLLHLMMCYLYVNKIATLIGLKMGFRVPLPPDPQKRGTTPALRRSHKKRVNVRKPDLGVVLHSNPVSLKPHDTRYDGILDLCIEALADTTKKAKERDTIEKKRDYEYARVKEYFILHGKGIESAFYRLNRWGIYEEIKPIDGDVIRSEVFPGFQFRTSDLYQLTPPEELVKDEVYRGFIMLKYQKVKAENEQRQQARLAEQEKEQQKRRAEQAEQEKEEARRLAEEERKQKEEALKRAEEAEKENERLAALLRNFRNSRYKTHP